MGSLAAGGAAAIGTGAFTSVTATRNVDVDVAGDASAYLRLEGTGGDNSEYVSDDGDGGTLSMNLDSRNETGADGEGVNPDAVTKIDDVFTIENQGTQEVTVTLSKTGHNSEMVKFYTNSNAYSGNPLGNNSVTLGTGEKITVSIKVDTEDEGVSDDTELLDSVTFTATAT